MFGPWDESNPYHFTAQKPDPPSRSTISAFRAIHRTPIKPRSLPKPNKKHDELEKELRATNYLIKRKRLNYSPQLLKYPESKPFHAEQLETNK